MSHWGCWGGGGGHSKTLSLLPGLCLPWPRPVFLLSSLHGCTALPFANAHGPHFAPEGIVKRVRRHKETQRTGLSGELFWSYLSAAGTNACQGKAETVKR